MNELLIQQNTDGQATRVAGSTCQTSIQSQLPFSQSFVPL